MRTEDSGPVRLEDYRPPAFLIDTVSLEVRLEPSATRVRARLSIRRNGDHAAALRLDGENLKPLSFHLDGAPLDPARLAIDAHGLTLEAAPDAFVFESEVEIDPAANSALEGLYLSGGRFYTQCEPEGFRNITWFIDRPDVLSCYDVRIEADAARFPTLLSNGNPEGAGVEDGRAWARWRDPFPKPSYLFALVGGAFDSLEDNFTTASGRVVTLRVFVDPDQAPRAVFALDALKRAMAWDETAYGREYDLDLFMIVAVRDFNMGAMENKGLNIFNSSVLLADPETATDADFERIESIVAHEYFHNWTGNRITCRDWFQLCVKEGLTVFRDQEFSADMRGEAVQRIKDVRALKARQFPEDAGPLAHPVRPAAYVKIDNFYTATVYEKGAEIIRVLKTLIGASAFRAGMDLYFARFDGQAVTVEDFLSCFAETVGRDLADVARWYAQAGTPELTLETRHDPDSATLELAFDQGPPRATVGLDPAPPPLPAPVRLGLLTADGTPLPFRLAPEGEPVLEAVLTVDAQKTRFTLHGVADAPIVSALRGFSAPVNLTYAASASDRRVRLSADPDLFNRWEAGQSLARDLILRRAEGRPDAPGEAAYVAALGRTLSDPDSVPAFCALAASLPGETELAMAQAVADPAALHAAREALRAAVLDGLGDALVDLYARLNSNAPYSPDAQSAGRRALRNGVLDLLCARDGPEARARARAHFEHAANMTDSMAGLAALASLEGEDFDAALAQFYDRWRHDPLVIDKWFSAQARSVRGDALGRVLGLTVHPDFDPRNPNRFRALIQAFAVGNPFRFHAEGGMGHRIVADQIMAVNALNPSSAARLVEVFGGWRRYAEPTATSMRASLERIVAAPGMSANVLELAHKALA